MDSCQCLFLLLAVIAALTASSEGVTKCLQCTNAVTFSSADAHCHWQFCTQLDAACEIVTSTYNTGTTYNSRCVSRSRCGSRRFPVLPALPRQDADYRERVSVIQRKYAVKPDLKKPIKPTLKRYLIERCVKCVKPVNVSLKPIVLKVTCDDIVSVYIDGQTTPIVQNNNWQQVSSVQIPGHTKVVAIKCRDKAKVKVGIIASLSNGVVTDDSWQCSGTPMVGWTGMPFTPISAWASATIIPNTAAWGNYAQNGGISSSARWIWTSQYSYPGWDTTVYCRKQLY